MAAATTTKPGTLAEALVAFHADPPKIFKDAINPHFKNRYASLETIMEAVRPKLAARGLAVSQHPSVLESGMPALRTILLHVSGERLESIMPLAVEKPGPQALGSALTYARRYAVLAVLGLVADEDDDANGAQPVAEKPQAAAETSPFQAPVPRNAPNGRTTVEHQIEALTAKLIAGGNLTQDQLDNGAKNISPEELLAKLTKYADSLGVA